MLEKSSPEICVTVPSIVKFKAPFVTVLKFSTLTEISAVVKLPAVAFVPLNGKMYKNPPPVLKLGTGVNKACAILKVREFVPKSVSTAEG